MIAPSVGVSPLSMGESMSSGPTDAHDVGVAESDVEEGSVVMTNLLRALAASVTVALFLDWLA